MIGEIKRNGELIVNSIVRYDNQERLNQYPPPFNQVITQIILESKAIAASDASVKDGEIGGAWIIKNNEGDKLLSNEIHHKE